MLGCVTLCARGQCHGSLLKREGTGCLHSTGWEIVYREFSIAMRPCQRQEVSWALLSKGSKEIMWLEAEDTRGTKRRNRDDH